MRNFISKSVQQIPPSGIRKYFDIAATMQDVITLGIGEPDFVTPEHITAQGIASLTAGRTGYTSNSGLLELRVAISDYMARLYGIHYAPDSQVLVTVGVSEALYLSLRAICDPLDEVLVVEPCFVANAVMVSLAGGIPVTVPTYVENNFEVTAQDLKAKITPRTKAILISYPNNPTGAVLSRQALLEIAQVAEEYDLLVISDEIYERLVYGVEHVNFASLPGMAERTISLSGVSKSYAMTGWRIGYVCAPEMFMEPMRKIHQYLIMSAPTMGQYAALEALTHGEDDVTHMRESYNQRRRLIVDGFNSIGMLCYEPRGAFYAFPGVAHTGLSDQEFCDLLLQEEHVAVIPGSAFGASGTGFVRASYTNSYHKIEAALERMGHFMQRHGFMHAIGAIG